MQGRLRQTAEDGGRLGLQGVTTRRGSDVALVTETKENGAFQEADGTAIDDHSRDTGTQLSEGGAICKTGQVSDSKTASVQLRQVFLNRIQKIGFICLGSGDIRRLGHLDIKDSIRLGTICTGPAAPRGPFQAVTERYPSESGSLLAGKQQAGIQRYRRCSLLLRACREHTLLSCTTRQGGGGGRRRYGIRN